MPCRVMIKQREPEARTEFSRQTSLQTGEFSSFRIYLNVFDQIFLLIPDVMKRA